jgi:uncharacterized coiled-coil protein SlyX
VNLLDVLSDVNTAAVKGWDTRHRDGPFHPVGVMNHHTANPAPGPAPSLDLVAFTGRPDLKAPLCNFLLDRHGVVHVVASGRANHAGKGRGDVILRAETERAPETDATNLSGTEQADGNAAFWGIEWELNGRGEQPTATQWASGVRLNAALCHHYGWTANRCIGHREFTRRKVDPEFSMAALRRDVAAYLVGTPQEEDDMFSDTDRKLLEGLNVGLTQTKAELDEVKRTLDALVSSVNEVRRNVRQDIELDGGKPGN